MSGAREDTTGKVIWVCRENIGRSQVAEAFWERDFPHVPVLSAGIHVDSPGQAIEDCEVADTLIKTLRSSYDIDISSRTRQSIDNLTLEAIGKAALVVILAEPEVITEELSTLENAILWEVPDMKETDPTQTLHIVEVIEGGIESIYKIYSNLHQAATDVQLELPFDEKIPQ